MYIANRRYSSKINGCSPLQFHIGLISLKLAIAHFAYTHPCSAIPQVLQSKGSSLGAPCNSHLYRILPFKKKCLSLIKSCKAGRTVVVHLKTKLT